MKTIVTLTPIAVILLAFAWWIAALFMPAFEVHSWSGGHVWMGHEVLAIGWMGPLDLHFGWYANLLLVPWLLVVPFKPGWATAIAVAAMLLALTSFSVLRGIMSDPGRADFVAFHAGFFVWLVVFGIALLGSTVAWRMRVLAGVDRAKG